MMIGVRASLPRVREAAPEVSYFRSKLPAGVAFHELRLASGVRLVLGVNEQGKIVSGSNPMLGGDFRTARERHMQRPGATHKEYPPDEMPEGWDRHPLHGYLRHADLELGPKATTDAYTLSMLEAHRPDPAVPEGLARLTSPHVDGPDAYMLTTHDVPPSHRNFEQAAQDLGDLRQAMYEDPAGQAGLGLRGRARMARVEHARDQADDLYTKDISEPRTAHPPLADSRRPGVENPARSSDDEGDGGGGSGGPPGPPPGAPPDPTMGVGAGGPLTRLPRRRPSP